MQPHVRALRRAGGHVHRPAPTASGTRLTQEALVVEDRRQEHRRPVRDADQRPRRVGARPRRAVGGARCSTGCSTCSTRSPRSGWATSRSTGRPARCPGGEAQRTKMIRHLGSSLTDVTYVFDEPTIGLHPHDIERMNDAAAAAARQGQHRARRRAQARDDRDRRPRRRPRARAPAPAAATVCFEGTVEGLRAQRHRHRPPPRRPGHAQGVGAHAVRRAGGPRRVDAQPAGRRRRHPARRALRRHRRRRLGQELADPRLGRRPRRRGGRSTRARSAARAAATRRRTPGCSSRSARRSPRPTA